MSKLIYSKNAFIFNVFRTKAQKKVLLFKHLHQYERELSVTRPYPIVGAHIHPAVLQLGLQVKTRNYLF